MFLNQQMIEDIDNSTSYCKSLSSPYIFGIQYMKNQWNTDCAGKIPESCGCTSPGVTSKAQVSNPAQCSSNSHTPTNMNKEQEKGVSPFPKTWLYSDEVESLFRLKCSPFAETDELTAVMCEEFLVLSGKGSLNCSFWRFLAANGTTKSCLRWK